MKILILQDIPIDLPTEKFSIACGMQRAFRRNGFNSYVIDTVTTDSKYFTSIFEKFDILLITQNYGLDKIEYVKEFKGLKIFWSIDSHKDFERHKKFITDNNIDITLVSNYNYVNKFDNSYWFPNCYPSDLITPTSFKNRPVQIGFCGSISNRKKWLTDLNIQCSMHLAINIIAEDMVRELYSYKIGWNRNEADDINFRTFEVMGAGCLLITNKTPGINKLLFGRSCIIYNNYDQCIDLIKYYLVNEEERIQIAINGYNEVRKNHSYDARVSKLIKIIETGEDK